MWCFWLWLHKNWIQWEIKKSHILYQPNCNWYMAAQGKKTGKRRNTEFIVAPQISSWCQIFIWQSFDCVFEGANELKNEYQWMSKVKKNIYEKVKIKILQYKCMKFLFTKVEKLFIASTKGEYFKPSNFPSYIHNIQWPFPYKQYTY